MEEHRPDRTRVSGALTGSSRKLKDNAADWHNLMLRWEKLNDQGATAADAIVEQRHKPANHEESAENPPDTQKLEAACSELLTILSKMEAIVGKMQRLAASTRGVLELQTFQHGSECASLFHSWPTQIFVEMSEQWLSSYQQELAVKRCLVAEMAHAPSWNMSVVYRSCWLHQPYLHPNGRRDLEALLLETGHRPA